MAHQVFISYSSKDKPAADAACAKMEAKGIRCWVAPRDILPGMEWGESIIDAISDADLMVLIFSSHANDSPQIRREVERAVSKEIPILPLRIEDVPPSRSLEYFISTPHWLDAMTPPLDQHLEKLSQTVQVLLGQAKQSEVDEEAAQMAAAAEQSAPYAAPRVESPSAGEQPAAQAAMPGPQTAIPQWQQAGSVPAAAPADRYDPLPIAALITGGLSVFSCIIACVGIFFSLVPIGLGIAALVRKDEPKWMSYTGIGLGAIAEILSLINMIVGLAMTYQG